MFSDGREFLALAGRAVRKVALGLIAVALAAVIIAFLLGALMRGGF